MRKYRALSILFMFLLISCQSSKISRSTLSGHSGLSSTEPITYPHWFWYTPTHISFPTAVGYALTGAYPEKSEQQAIDDGIERLAKSVQIRVYGKHWLKDGKLVQQFDEETEAHVKAQVKETYQLLANHQGKKLTMVLVGLGTEAGLSNHLKTADPSAPNWLQKLPHQPGYTYAIGHTFAGAHPKNAWTGAEHNARANLALGIKSDTSHRSQLVTGKLASDTVIETNITLTGIETVARWYNAKNRNCYVLARVPITAN